MKYSGQSLQATVPRKFLTFPKGDASWTFSVSPLPLGFFEVELEEKLPSPDPAKRPATNSRGEFIHDANGFLCYWLDRQEKGYRHKAAKASQRQTVYTVWKLLKTDASFETETNEATYPTPEAFCDALWEEFALAGFTPGDFQKILQAALELAGLENLTKKLEEKSSDFFAQAEGTTNTENPL